MAVPLHQHFAERGASLAARVFEGSLQGTNQGLLQGTLQSALQSTMFTLATRSAPGTTSLAQEVLWL
jgi:hypothetical protein